MSDQNQKPADNSNNNPPSSGSGSSLLNRIGTKPGTPPAGNPPNNPPQQNTPSSSPFGSRPAFGGGGSNNASGSGAFGGGSRFGSGTTNNNQPASPPPSPFRPVPARDTVEYALLPLRGMAVRFELKGLGDPFYRLLGHEVNTENSDSRLVVRKLEQGGEDVKAIQAILDKAWEKYAFKGAAMIYSLENESLVKQLNAPSLMPKKDFFDDDDDNEKKDEPPKPAVKILRAIDMVLVLNILGRARTQVLIGSSPTMFSQHYLNRAIVTDDPRLVALAMATGVI